MINLNSEEKNKYKKAGKIAKEALHKGKEVCEEGEPYFKVVNEVEKIIHKRGAKPAFPVNVSVNEIGAHYATYPGDGKVFKRGDVVKIDVGVHIDGYIADTALTLEVGTNRHRQLIKSAEEALKMALKTIRPGIKAKKIGKNIKSVIENFGFKPISNLSGHAIQPYELHSGTSIPNVPKKGGKIKEGMVVATEPFATNGRGKVNDGEKSEIYRLQKKRNIKEKDIEFYEWIEKRFKHLPFTPRWCKSYGDDYRKRLYRLTKYRTAMVYPVLIEADNGIVSQREHTAIVTSSGAEITTN